MKILLLAAVLLTGCAGLVPMQAYDGPRAYEG